MKGSLIKVNIGFNHSEDLVFTRDFCGDFLVVIPYEK